MIYVFLICVLILCKIKTPISSQLSVNIYFYVETMAILPSSGYGEACWIIYFNNEFSCKD